MICPNCGFILMEEDMICPICESVITKNIETGDVDVKPKTNKAIIISLTYMFSVSVAMIFLLICMDYRPKYRNMGLRPYVFIGIMFIHKMALIEQPFFNEPFAFKKRLKDKKALMEEQKNNFMYYFILMCIFLLFWNLIFGRFALMDLRQYSKGILTEDMIQKRYMVYTALYYITTIFCYIPYLVYYYFSLNFEYSDTKKYLKHFVLINWILFSIFFLINFGKLF